MMNDLKARHTAFPGTRHSGVLVIYVIVACEKAQSNMCLCTRYMYNIYVIAQQLVVFPISQDAWI